MIFLSLSLHLLVILLRTCGGELRQCTLRVCVVVCVCVYDSRVRCVSRALTTPQFSTNRTPSCRARRTT